MLQVESLFDSLTGYFDPSEGRRRRQRTKTYEEEQNEKVCFLSNNFKINLKLICFFFSFLCQVIIHGIDKYDFKNCFIQQFSLTWYTRKFLYCIHFLYRNLGMNCFLQVQMELFAQMEKVEANEKEESNLS